MPLEACGQCVKDIFVSDAEFIERFTGKQLWTWGFASGGATGSNCNASRSSPVQTVSGGSNWKQVSANRTPSALYGNNMAATKTDGTLWTWGCGCFGILGNNSIVNRSSPVQTVSNVTTWKCVSVGTYNMAGLKIDGTLWMWGGGGAGRNGDNTQVCRSSPVQTVSATTNWRNVSVGFAQTAAIKTDGTLWVWGSDFAVGALGRNTTSANVSSPVQTISGGTNWKSISVGYNVVSAIKTDGTLWLWGRNDTGALGNDTVSSASSPVQTISGGTNWKQVSAGSRVTASIKNDGTLWIWGLNNNGQIGINVNAATCCAVSSPVQTVSGGTNWRCVSIGQNQNCSSFGLKTDGTLWAWGSPQSGVFGDGIGRPLSEAISSPVQGGSLATTWKSVAAGGAIGALRVED